MNLICFKSLERDAGGKPLRTFPHPALASGVLLLALVLGGAARAQEDPIDALLKKPAVPPIDAPQAAPPAAAPAPDAAPATAPPPAAAPSEALPTNRDVPRPAASLPPVNSPVVPPPASPVNRFPLPETDVNRSADAPHYAPMPLRPPPQAYTPRAPGLTEPMHIEETGKAPDGPPSSSDLYFESRVRKSFAAAQGMQGPLDGRWVVRAAGIELYDLQLVDKNQGAVEGAWRDPRRRGAADATGFIDSIQRSGGDLTVRFQPRPGSDPVQLSLRQLGDSWTGDLIERGDRQTVTVRRN
jgi:hypothetical protein